MAEVREAIGVPLMADESIRNPRSAMEVIRRKAADIANVYVTEAGRPTQRVAHLRDVRGGGDAMHDRQHARVRHRHRGADPSGRGDDESGPDSDTCGVLYHSEDLLTKPLKIEADMPTRRKARALAWRST